MHTHLIVGNTGDYHAMAVGWALQKLGEDVLIWDGIGSQPEALLSFDFTAHDHSIRLGQRDFSSFASVWFRRPVASQSLSNVHPDARKFVDNEMRSSHVALGIEAQELTDFVVGGQAGKAADSKIRQLNVARQCGLAIPETLISNDYIRIREFASRTPAILVKHFTPHAWGNLARKSVRGVGPRRIHDFATLNRASVEMCPAIYQQTIEKKSDVRVTVIGERVYAAKIASGKGHSFFDWRGEYNNPEFVVSEFELEKETQNSVRGLMRMLGLNYGCIDFAVDMDDRLVFLEINPDGQFLFVESYNRAFPLLNAFASMLAARSGRYHLSDSADINLAAFEASKAYADLKDRDPVPVGSEKFVTHIH